MLPFSTFLEAPPSPIQELHAAVFTRQSIRLLVKRDDLLHPHISGNKWRKLKFNLAEARVAALTACLSTSARSAERVARTLASWMASMQNGGVGRHCFERGFPPAGCCGIARSLRSIRASKLERFYELSFLRLRQIHTCPD